MQKGKKWVVEAIVFEGRGKGNCYLIDSIFPVAGADSFVKGNQKETGSSIVIGD